MKFLYTLYEVALTPGAELAHAFPTTSRTSFSCISDMLNYQGAAYAIYLLYTIT